MTDQQQTEGGETAIAESPVPSIPAAASAAFEPMIAAIPDADEGDGLEGMLAQLAGADSLDALNQPWATNDLGQYAGAVLTIRGVTKRRSQFGGGLPWFLVIDASDEDTGELLTLTTSATMAVAQLTRAYVLGQLPARARVVVAERPTKNGYYPQHLEFLPRKGAAGNGNGKRG